MTLDFLRPATTGAVALWLMVAVPHAQVPEALVASLRQAGMVVVGTVVGTEPSWVESSHGDRLIVTRTTVSVEESLAGATRVTRGTMLRVDLPGGTAGGVTLSVGGAPPLAPGDRAVFALDPGADGGHRLRPGDDGVRRIDADGHALTEPWTLSQLRAALSVPDDGPDTDGRSP